MNTVPQKTVFPAATQQIANNTTSWIGHVPGDSKEFIKGQTFIAREEGDLQTIEIFSNIVSDPGNVMMTIHSFDPRAKTWSAVLGSAQVAFAKTDTGKWIPFHIPGLHLVKGQSYGFRLQSSDSFIGVGEAAGSSRQPPLDEGQEWRFTNTGNQGDAYSYFSLAFKIGLRA
ncbi:MAG: hypothetical protein JWQ27_555 [Ferruginibacter sp.]|nr:hypothetical protein [Ferruginibacter sp.]